MKLPALLRVPLLSVAPTLSAVLVAAAGAMLLASGATPSRPSRVVALLHMAPALLIEVSHFLSSVLGLVLLLLAFGLRRRLGAAYVVSLILLAITALLALAKGIQWEETAALIAILLILAPLSDAFPRKAGLSQIEITPGWWLSVVAVLAGCALLGWWTFHNVNYDHVPWWKVMADADAARSLRSSAAAAVLLLGVGVWRLLASSATPPLIGEEDADFERVKHILHSAEVAEPFSNLALLGDKRFLFSPSGESFLMFGVRGRSWIALGAPVGRRDERSELLWRFRELADAHAARPGIYGLTAEDLPEVVEMGLSLQKTGEAAVVSIESFALEGRRRGNLRRAWRKAAEEGASFEVLAPQAVPDCMDELRAISDEWLSHHAGGEKGFSMGGFTPAYVAHFPVAVMRQSGRIVAFASLWTTANRATFSLDLMRYRQDAAKNAMDYLFVELLLWGRSQGYAAFDFGMAPLAGLNDHPLAPMASRVGRLLFERAEALYNFQGLRRYKDKYDPNWQPRYIAAPSMWVIPILLADVGLLSSGGMQGLAKRPRRSLSTDNTSQHQI
ncbi:MAG: oxacillin resistance protein FmtC [Caulobacteraceae bacterium]|nr:oxacillin resistance protein FmtC [Caulobacteraceae bacterium]